MEISSDPTLVILAMPRFDDGILDMQELLRRLATCAGMSLRLSASSSV